MSGPLERLTPAEIDLDNPLDTLSLQLHVERYEFAAAHARPGRILDLACGAGFGSRILADRLGAGTEVWGVDVSSEALAHANAAYAAPNTRFLRADAFEFDDQSGFDTIVSLETLEHVREPEALVARFVRLLRRGGRLVASVPTTPSVDVNPHHLWDFTAQTFRQLVARQGLVPLAALEQVQPFSPFAVLGRRGRRTAGLRQNLLRHYIRHPRLAWRRLAATLRYGLENRYVTLVLEAAADAGRPVSVPEDRGSRAD